MLRNEYHVIVETSQPESINKARDLFFNKEKQFSRVTTMMKFKHFISKT